MILCHSKGTCSRPFVSLALVFGYRFGGSCGFNRFSELRTLSAFVASRTYVVTAPTVYLAFGLTVSTVLSLPVYSALVT